MTEIFRDKDGGWRFRVIGRNGEIIAASEAYTRPADAKRGLDALRAILAATAGQEPRVV